MFHSSTLNNRINKIHKQVLRLVYQNNFVFYLQDRCNSVTIHERNSGILETEIFKVRKGLVPDIIKEVFGIREPFNNLQSEANHFKRENIRSTHYDIQLVRYLIFRLKNMRLNTQ